MKKKFRFVFTFTEYENIDAEFTDAELEELRKKPDLDIYQQLVDEQTFNRVSDKDVVCIDIME